MEHEIRAELKQTFRPEFLNRLDETVVFRQLNLPERRQITRNLLEGVSQRLAEQEIFLTVTDRVVDLLTEQGYRKDYGARPLRRTIRSRVEDAIAGLLLEGALRPGDTVTLDEENGEVQVSVRHPETNSVPG